MLPTATTISSSRASRTRFPTGHLSGPPVVRLASGGAHDLVPEHERLGQLVARHVLLALGEEVGLVDRLVLLEPDDGDDLVAPPIARSAADDDVVDGGVVHEGVLDLFGEDL